MRQRMLDNTEGIVVVTFDVDIAAPPNEWAT